MVWIDSSSGRSGKDAEERQAAMAC
jgi:hypothetical protein